MQITRSIGATRVISHAGFQNILDAVTIDIRNRQLRHSIQR